MIRQHLRDCPVEHAEYYFLQKCIDGLEKLRFAPKGIHKLDEIVHEMRARADKFSGVSEEDKQRYTELATRFPRIVQPIKGEVLDWIVVRFLDCLGVLSLVIFGLLKILKE